MNKNCCNLLFYKGESCISKLIMYFTKSNYSHCALVYDDIHIYEADIFKPVNINHISYKSSNYDIYKFANITEQQKSKIVEYLNIKLQSKYDWLYIITRWFNILFGTKILNNKQRFTCDELIYDAFLFAGIKLIDGEINPGNLAKSLYLIKSK